MDNHKDLQLRDRDTRPTSELLEQTLGDSYTAYETFQEALPGLEIEQEWQWYTPHKAWFARGQYFWTTPRGVRKEKNLFWLHVYDGVFSVAVWFKEKNREEVLRTCVSEHTKKLIHEAKTVGKVATFPVVFEVNTAKVLGDIYSLIECKKRLESS